MYTKKTLKSSGKWPYSLSLFDANVRAGVLPSGALRMGKRIYTDAEGLEIEQAVIDDKILSFRAAYDQPKAA